MIKVRQNIPLKDISVSGETNLKKGAGIARLAWNNELEEWKQKLDKHERYSKNDASAHWTQTRPDFSHEVPACVGQHSILDLGSAMLGFFQRRAGFPKFKCRGRNDHFYLTNQEAKIVGNKIKIGKLGWYKLAEKVRYDDYRLLGVVVKRKPSGKWIVSLCLEIAEAFRTDSTDVVGIDVGCKHWAVASDGTICDSPKKLKYYERCLKKKQRLLARKQKGSHRRELAKLQVAKAYDKIHNVKLDTIHKFTSLIAKRFGTVCIETLNIEGMKRSHIASKGVQNSMMGELQRQLMYKCNNYVKIPMFYPSSKTCSNCGNVKEDLTLSDRTYHCRSCGIEIDRDLNAAINLRNKGLEIIYGGSHR